jgi:hypothetical protein
MENLPVITVVSLESGSLMVSYDALQVAEFLEAMEVKSAVWEPDDNGFKVVIE